MMNSSSVMKNMSNPNVILGKRQRGVVLIVALVMLLLLTIIGIAGIRETELQEKMAGGAQDRELALQAAESALRVGEALVRGAPGGVVPCPAIGLPAVALNRNELAFWQNAANWAGATAAPLPATSVVATPPQYVIEQLPSNYSAIGGTLNAGAPAGGGAQRVTDYLITARGTGATNNAVVILQSMYRCIGT